jgi:mRNA interferase MazF
LRRSSSYSPGDVILIEFQGAVETKLRPMIVVSTEQYHRERPDLMLGVLTTNVGAATSSSDYLLRDWKEAGLDKPSAFRCNLATRPQANVIRALGKLTERDWSAVQERVRRALDLGESIGSTGE